MRKILLTITLLTFTLVHASGPFTLTGLKKANIFVANKSELIDKNDVKIIKDKLLSVIKTLGLKTKQRDSATLMVKIDSLSSSDKHFIYIKLAVGEDVQTDRDEKIGAFAISYDSSDFIESEDPKNDIFESVQFLADEFMDHYKEDNE